MKSRIFQSLDEFKWWLSVGTPFALLGYLPAAFPHIFPLGVEMLMGATTIPYAIGATYGLVGTDMDPRAMGRWRALYFFTHPLRGTKALIKGLTTDGSGPGASLLEAAERHYGDGIQKRKEAWFEKKRDDAHKAKFMNGYPEEAAQLYAETFVAGLANGEPQQKAAEVAQAKLNEWEANFQKEELRKHLYNTAIENGYPEDAAKVYAEAFVDALMEGQPEEQASLAAARTLEEWHEKRGTADAAPELEPTPRSVKPDEILDPEPAQAADPSDAPTEKLPVIDGTATDTPDAAHTPTRETASTSTSTSSAFGNTRATRTAPAAAVMSVDDAAKERRSQIARDRYWKTQEVFQQYYADALHEIAAIEGNDPAAARAIARAALRTVRVECEGVSRKQNLAQPLSRDTARMADAMLQIATVGQQTAKLEVSERPLMLKRVAVPSAEVDIIKIQDLANFGLNGEGNPSQIGMSLQLLRLVHGATPRPERSGLNR